MKKFFLLSALISLAIFTSCNKQAMEEDIVHYNQEVAPMTTDHVITNLDDKAGKASFTIDHKQNSLFEKEALLVTNNSIEAVSYHWDFGNGDTSTDRVPSHKYDLHGYYTVTLKVTGANGSVSEVSKEVLVLCIYGGGDHGF